MTLYKKGTCKSVTAVSNKVLVCDSCRYTEIASISQRNGKKCPKCQAKMVLQSSEEI